MTLYRCTRCKGERALVLEVDELWLCPTCWRELGSPGPKRAVDALEEGAAAELRIREAMQRRGGPDRYRVRAGKT